MTSPLLETALGYANKGRAVFPLHGKIPAIAKEDGGHGYLDATTDTNCIKSESTRPVQLDRNGNPTIKTTLAGTTHPAGNGRAAL